MRLLGPGVCVCVWTFDWGVPVRSWVQAISKRRNLVMENDLFAQAEYQIGVESVTRSEDDLQLVSGLAAVSCALETTIVRDDFQVGLRARARICVSVRAITSAPSRAVQAFARLEHNEENILFWVHARVYELTHPLSSGRPTPAAGSGGGGGGDARSATDRASSAVGHGTSFSSTATDLDNDVDAAVAMTLASSVSGLWTGDGPAAPTSGGAGAAKGAPGLRETRPSYWGLAPRAQIEADASSVDSMTWPSDEAHATTVAHARTIFERFLRQGSAQWVRWLCVGVRCSVRSAPLVCPHCRRAV